MTGPINERKLLNTARKIARVITRDYRHWDDQAAVEVPKVCPVLPRLEGEHSFGTVMTNTMRDQFKRNRQHEYLACLPDDNWSIHGRSSGSGIPAVEAVVLAESALAAMPRHLRP